MLPGVSRFKRSLAALLAGSALAMSAFAQQPAPQTQPQPGQPQPQAQPEPPKWPDFAQVTKDMQAQQGLFTVYRYNPQDNSKDQTRLLAQIPRAL
jgi:hypothetical protein